MWITICFDTDRDFIKDSYIVQYNGFRIEVKRGSVDEGHNLFIEVNHSSDRAAFEAGIRFLSELAWLNNTGVQVLTSCVSSRKTPCNVTYKKFYRIQNCIGLEDYEQIAFSDEQKVALGIYREGVSSNSHFYSFLCYFRIINIRCSTRRDHINWINNNLNKVSANKSIINELKTAKVQDVGKHLYRSGRCAIAHACLRGNDPVVDADCYEDYSRINRELPLIKDFAEIFIQDELNVPNIYNAFNNTLLKRFKELFGKSIIDRVISDEQVDLILLPNPPKISFRVYDDARSFDSLKNLTFEILKAGNGEIILSNQSQDWPIHTQFSIDFVNKEIDFKVIEINKNHSKFNDKLLLDYYYFLSKYLPNGRLEIWNENKNELLARLPPYIPVDVDINGTIKNLQSLISSLETKIRNSGN